MIFQREKCKILAYKVEKAVIGGGSRLQSKNFVPVYEEIAKLVGEEQAVKIYEHFRGQQINFPQRLFNTNYVSMYVKENYNGKNIRELAKQFGYSERRIREFLKS